MASATSSPAMILLSVFARQGQQRIGIARLLTLNVVEPCSDSPTLPRYFPLDPPKSKLRAIFASDAFSAINPGRLRSSKSTSARHRPSVSGLPRSGGRRIRHAVAQLLGTREIEVTPRAALPPDSRVAQARPPGGPSPLVVRVSEDHVVHHLGDPTVVADLVEGLLCLRKSRPRPLDGLHLLECTTSISDRAADTGGHQELVGSRRSARSRRTASRSWLAGSA